MTISLVPCKVGVLAEAIVENYQARAAAKNITLRYEQPAAMQGRDSAGRGAPQPMVIADAVLLPQVLDNLVSNAVKYSPHGKNVFIRILPQAPNSQFSGNQATTRIEVQDEGPGLSAPDKEKLFEKFTRLSARPTGGEYTTGLGLSIVKKMVEAMNGRVWCESEFGKGATFIVELPAVRSFDGKELASTSSG